MSRLAFFSMTEKAGLSIDQKPRPNNMRCLSEGICSCSYSVMRIHGGHTFIHEGKFATIND